MAAVKGETRRPGAPGGPGGRQPRGCRGGRVRSGDRLWYMRIRSPIGERFGHRSCPKLLLFRAFNPSNCAVLLRTLSQNGRHIRAAVTFVCEGEGFLSWAPSPARVSSEAICDRFEGARSLDSPPAQGPASWHFGVAFASLDRLDASRKLTRPTVASLPCPLCDTYY